MEDVDLQILNSIKNDFKTAKQVSEELNLPRARINNKLKSFRKYNMVHMKTEKSSAQGKNPVTYKKK